MYIQSTCIYKYFKSIYAAVVVMSCQFVWKKIKDFLELLTKGQKPLLFRFLWLFVSVDPVNIDNVFHITETQEFYPRTYG